MTRLEHDERAALCGDRAAVICIVSALREYRAAVERLLASRYRDGFVDGAATNTLALAREDIEEGRRDE